MFLLRGWKYLSTRNTKPVTTGYWKDFLFEKLQPTSFGEEKHQREEKEQHHTTQNDRYAQQFQQKITFFSTFFRPEIVVVDGHGCSAYHFFFACFFSTATASSRVTAMGSVPLGRR